MPRPIAAAAMLAAFGLAGCATDPIGPTARVMPAPGKPFAVFAQDQANCKQFASGEVGGGAALADLKRLGGAALSSGLGAGLGAAIGHGRSTGIGAALGGIAGAAAGGSYSARDQHDLQSRYDLAYSQCMYSRGNQVAGVPPAGQAAGVPPAGQIAGFTPAGQFSGVPPAGGFAPTGQAAGFAPGGRPAGYAAAAPAYPPSYGGAWFVR